MRVSSYHQMQSTYQKYFIKCTLLIKSILLLNNIDDNLNNLKTIRQMI